MTSSLWVVVGVPWDELSNRKYTKLIHVANPHFDQFTKIGNICNAMNHTAKTLTCALKFPNECQFSYSQWFCCHFKDPSWFVRREGILWSVCQFGISRIDVSDLLHNKSNRKRNESQIVNESDLHWTSGVSFAQCLSFHLVIQTGLYCIKGRVEQVALAITRSFPV